VRAPLFIDVIYILASLAIMIGAIALLDALGYGVGFNIFPIGEDNHWIDILRRGQGADAARLLWAIDNRNPLSPWWYIVTLWDVRHSCSFGVWHGGDRSGSSVTAVRAWTCNFSRLLDVESIP
jgi:hypothetical protein